MNTIIARIRNAFDRQVRAWDLLLAHEQPWLAEVQPTSPPPVPPPPVPPAPVPPAPPPRVAVDR